MSLAGHHGLLAQVLGFNFITDYATIGFDPYVITSDTVIWSDNLGNSHIGSNPNFNYLGSEGNKTINVKITGNSPVNIDFLSAGANPNLVLVKGIFDISNIKKISNLDLRHNEVTELILSEEIDNTSVSIKLAKNELMGILDLSRFTNISSLLLGGLDNITDIIFNQTQNGTKISLVFDSKPWGIGSGTMTNLANVNFSAFSGKICTVFSIAKTALVSIDLSIFLDITGIIRIVENNVLEAVDASKYSGKGLLEIASNPNLNQVIFPSMPVSNLTLGNFWIYNNPLLTSIDVSWLKECRGQFSIRTNALTSIVFPLDGIYYNGVQAHENKLISVDISGIATISGIINFRNNPGLHEIIFPPLGSMDGVKEFWVNDCSFSNFVFLIGTLLKPNIIALHNNSMTISAVNSNINNIYEGRVMFDDVVKTLNIGGTNAAASGIYQAPSGYVQANETTIGNDGTPSSAKEQIFVLINQNNDNSLTKKYKWTIIYN